MPVVVVAAAVAIGFAVLMQRREAPQAQLFPLDGAALRGSRNAPLAIVAFSDFQCPFCAHFADTTFRELDRDYIADGKVVFAFRHLPLPNHAHAFAAASAAVCAELQGKFWEMHDRLFANAKALKDAPWRTFAGDLGLDRARFDSCLRAEGPETVGKDLALAQALEISGTPAFLIGTTDPGGVRISNRIDGALPIGSFKSIIDPLLASSSQPVRSRR